MTEKNVDSLVLEHLRYLRGKIDLLIEKSDMHTQRLNSLEQSVALLHSDMANVNLRLDNFGRRLERIENHLELIHD
jgi:hypothetical protein